MKGLSRLLIPLNTFERVLKDEELKDIYREKERYKIFISSSDVPKLKGSGAIKSHYYETSFLFEKGWVGKLREIMSSDKELNKDVQDKRVMSYIRGINQTAMLEKIAYDAYRLFSDGLFATPRTR